MTGALWVALGGALGSLGRYFATQWVTALAGSAFPWGTVLVNVTGCALIGFFAGHPAWLTRSVSSAFVRDFLVIGICGGYTTFSAFSLQTLQLLQAGQAGRAAANVGVSVVCCLVSTFAGYTLARAAA